jgi:hypothetical protein
VRVGFDAAGDYDFAGGVYDPSDVVGQGVGSGHGDNSLALHRYVIVARSPWGNYSSASDNQV